MIKKEMEDLIQSVCDKFKRETGIEVTKQAIEELLTPAVPHLEEVTQKLYESRISISFLEESIRTVLNNAYIFAQDRKHNYVGFQDVRDSMAKDCPYAFWC